MKVIIIEGPDGCGKTTQVNLLREKIPSLKYYREPGSTAVGERLRSILLDPEVGDLDPITEAMMFTASRIELYKHIKENSNDDDVIIFDRSYISTYVYQLYNADNALSFQLKKLTKEIIYKFIPDHHVLYIRTPYEVLKTRRKSRGDKDRFEDKSDEDHNRVFCAYEALLHDEYDYIIDGNNSIEEIHQSINDIVKLLIHK